MARGAAVIGRVGLRTWLHFMEELAVLTDAYRKHPGRF